MRFSLLLLPLAALITTGLHAQHCPFDGAAILVLDVHREGDTSTIPGLHITLHNQNDQPLMTEWWRDDVRERDTLTFWRNVEETTLTSSSGSGFQNYVQHHRYPFARDHYVMVVSAAFPIEQYRLVIEDRDGDAGGGSFGTLILPLTPHDLFPLCGTYDDEVYAEFEERRDGRNIRRKYWPITVSLSSW